MLGLTSNLRFGCGLPTKAHLVRTSIFLALTLLLFFSLSLYFLVLMRSPFRPAPPTDQPILGLVFSSPSKHQSVLSSTVY
jgi:hypothetical protein